MQLLHRVLPDLQEVPLEKPVGTIWVAAGNKEKILTAKLTEDEGREKNIQAATAKTLQLLLDLCQNQENEH